MAVITAPSMNNSVICKPYSKNNYSELQLLRKGGSVIQKPLFPLELNGKVGNAK